MFHHNAPNLCQVQFNMHFNLNYVNHVHIHLFALKGNNFFHTLPTLYRNGLAFSTSLLHFGLVAPSHRYSLIQHTHIMPCSVNAYGNFLMWSPLLFPFSFKVANCDFEKSSFLEVAICDFKISSSSVVNWNIKSSGNLAILRFTCSFKRFTSYHNY